MKNNNTQLEVVNGTNASSRKKIKKNLEAGVDIKVNISLLCLIRKKKTMLLVYKKEYYSTYNM